MEEEKTQEGGKPGARSPGAHDLSSAGELMVEHGGENPLKAAQAQPAMGAQFVDTLAAANKEASRRFSQEITSLFSPGRSGFFRK